MHVRSGFKEANRPTPLAGDPNYLNYVVCTWAMRSTGKHARIGVRPLAAYFLTSRAFGVVRLVVIGVSWMFLEIRKRLAECCWLHQVSFISL